jgi:hypothetical protein
MVPSQQNSAQAAAVCAVLTSPLWKSRYAICTKYRLSATLAENVTIILKRKHNSLRLSDISNTY